MTLCEFEYLYTFVFAYMVKYEVRKYLKLGYIL